MAAAAATLVYLTVFLLSFWATRKVVTTRGLGGALRIAVGWVVLVVFFAYAPSIAPFAPLDQSLSFAFAQMVLTGSALGIPAGFYNRWRTRTNK